MSVLGTRFQTPVCKRTLNPVFNAKGATFDFPIYLSTSDKLGVVEFVVWDKDMLRKEYLGEFALPLDEWFKGNAFGFEDHDNQARRILLSKFYSIREISPHFIAFLRQPHILTRDDQCNGYYGHQNWLCPPSQCHDCTQFRGDLQINGQTFSPEPGLSYPSTYPRHSVRYITHIRYRRHEA